MQMPHEGQRGRRAANYVQRQVLSWREIYRNEELAAHAASSRGKKGGGVALLACSAFWFKQIAVAGHLRVYVIWIYWLIKRVVQMRT